MILDEQALFSDNQEVKATAASTNIIKVGGDIGKGTPVEAFVQVMTTFAGLTSLEVKVETCDTADGTFEVLNSTGAIAAAKLTEGTRLPIKFLPMGIKKFLRLNYVVTGSGTAGKLTAGIVDGVPESYHN